MSLANQFKLTGRVWGDGLPPPVHVSRFTAADATALNAYTPDQGNAWVQRRSSTWEIQGNRARKTSSGNEQFAVTDCAISDVMLTATWVVGSPTGNAGLVVRASASPTDTYWLIKSQTNGNPTLFEVINGTTFHNRASGTPPGGTPAGASIAFKVIAQGTTITAYWDNVQILTYGSASGNQSATRHGIWIHGGAGVDDGSTFDDVIVRPAV